VPGVGPIIALTILTEAGDLRRFGHHRQFLKFCGLDLATYQSGKFRGQTDRRNLPPARQRGCIPLLSSSTALMLATSWLIRPVVSQA
jgi:hypothetical protein